MKISIVKKNGILSDLQNMVDKLQFLPETEDRRIDRKISEAQWALESAIDKLKELEATDEDDSE